MRNLWILAPATALAATLATAHTTPAGPIVPSLAVEATFEKVGERGQYACTSRVTDLASGLVLTEPRTVFLAGEPATTTSQAAEGYEVEISLFVARGGGQVDHVVIVRRDGAKVAAHSTTVKLPL